MHIVEEHGGRISFESGADVTTFSIQLPLTSARPKMSLEGTA
jgi:nitrogen-specific signal transduction histidine kinase